jgi:hypothetical protein
LSFIIIKEFFDSWYSGGPGGKTETGEKKENT